MAIRYPRGRGSEVDWQVTPEILPIGKGRTLHEGCKVAFLTLGPIGVTVSQVVEWLHDEGMDVGHYDMVFVKPLDEDLLHRVASQYNAIITVEDGCIMGGMGSAVLEFFANQGYCKPVRRIGVPDDFIPHGTSREQYAFCGMDAESIYRVAQELLAEKYHI